MVETSAKSEFFRRWRGHLPDARIEHDWQERDNRRLLEKDPVLDLLMAARSSLLDFEYGKIEDDATNLATQRYQALLVEINALLRACGRPVGGETA
jgi:hypothetical protein